MLRSRRANHRRPALLAATLAATPALAQQRTGTAPCRQGALALIAMLDGKDDKSADYKHAFEAVTQTCGPVAKARDITPSPARELRQARARRARRHRGRQINTPVFVRARDQFAASCAPG